jgi:hypothetical protein
VTRLYEHVRNLTSIDPPRNYSSLGSLDQAAQYIISEFEKAGAKPDFQEWEASGALYRNILASYNPASSRRLIVGAHYDVCGDQPGADDNASAVAGLLELARMLFQEGPILDYRIDFVAYCLEEPPFFGSEDMGSYVHARSLHESGAQVIGMICLEMIGYFSDKPHSQRYPTPALARMYPHTANFIIVVGIGEYSDFNSKVHRLMQHDASIDVQQINFPDRTSLAGLSDQRSYWAFGYPALMINDTAFIRNPHYHQPSDTIDTLDFPKMKAVVEAAYRAVTGMDNR